MPLCAAAVRDITFDPRARRFEADVILCTAASEDARHLRVSAPGHPQWGLRRTMRALVDAATRH